MVAACFLEPSTVNLQLKRKGNKITFGLLPHFDWTPSVSFRFS